MLAQSTAVKALGWILIALGIIAFAYGFTVGALRGHIGSKTSFTSDAVAIIVGWFSLLIGPALAFGEVPIAIKRRVEAARR
jgi:uncharacterized membrane protein YraQ (UPF0718 family)